MTYPCYMKKVYKLRITTDIYKLAIHYLTQQIKINMHINNDSCSYKEEQVDSSLSKNQVLIS